jgi:hypothetical protein
MKFAALPLLVVVLLSSLVTADIQGLLRRRRLACGAVCGVYPCADLPYDCGTYCSNVACPGGSSSSSGCFPGDASVLLASRRHVKMSELALGDLVQSQYAARRPR